MCVGEVDITLSCVTHMLREDVLYTCSTYAYLWGVKDSHLGQEEPAVEFDILSSGTCDTTLPSALQGKATLLLSGVTEWKGKGDRSCVHSKGAVVELLPWSKRR